MAEVIIKCPCGGSITIHGATLYNCGFRAKEFYEEHEECIKATKKEGGKNE